MGKIKTTVISGKEIIKIENDDYAIIIFNHNSKGYILNGHLYDQPHILGKITDEAFKSIFGFEKHGKALLEFFAGIGSSGDILDPCSTVYFTASKVLAAVKRYEDEANKPKETTYTVKRVDYFGVMDAYEFYSDHHILSIPTMAMVKLIEYDTFSTGRATFSMKDGGRVGYETIVVTEDDGSIINLELESNKWEELIDIYKFNTLKLLLDGKVATLSNIKIDNDKKQLIITFKHRQFIEQAITIDMVHVYKLLQGGCKADIPLTNKCRFTCAVSYVYEDHKTLLINVLNREGFWFHIKSDISFDNTPL